ncbi:MAG: GlxA family transcriptional regulator [Pseudomonadota bacterium]
MRNYSFVLVPRFSLVAFSCAIDALRGANQVLGEPYYSWNAVSADGAPTISTSAIEVPTKKLSETVQPDMIVICGGDSSHTYRNANLTNWLHDQAKRGKQIGSISDGAFVAAEAGLFDKVPSTIHWKCYDAYRERYPDLEIKPSMIEISANRFSCAGGTASLDLMLHFIREDHGPEITSQIADNYFHDTIRDSSREQHVTNAFRLASRNPILAEALLLMESHLEGRLTISDIAGLLEISRRQLDRIFKRHMKQSPQEFYRYLRLTRASGLLLQTNMSITEIAIGCGFQSASHMGKYFHKRFGLTPGGYRKQNAVY